MTHPTFTNLSLAALSLLAVLVACSTKSCDSPADREQVPAVPPWVHGKLTPSTPDTTKP